MERLCHVTTAPVPPRLSAEPFLHCCSEAQLAFVLARHFPGRSGLVVLRFAMDAVEGRVAWEVSEPGLDPFPHLYGTLLTSRCQHSTLDR